MTSIPGIWRLLGDCDTADLVVIVLSNVLIMLIDFRAISTFWKGKQDIVLSLDGS